MCTYLPTDLNFIYIILKIIVYILPKIIIVDIWLVTFTRPRKLNGDLRIKKCVPSYLPT